MAQKQRKKATQKGKTPNKKVPQPPKSIFGNIFFYVFLFLGLYIFMTALSGYTAGLEIKSISETLDLIKQERVQNIVVSGDDIEVLLQDGTKFVSEKESSVSFDEILTNNEIDRSLIAGEYKVEHRVGFEDVIGPLLSFGLPILILLFIFRQMRGAGGDIMSFGKSRARLFNKNAGKKVTFSDVAGAEEAKKEVMEIVDFLKHPKKTGRLRSYEKRG